MLFKCQSLEHSRSSHKLIQMASHHSPSPKYYWDRYETNKNPTTAWSRPLSHLSNIYTTCVHIWLVFEQHVYRHNYYRKHIHTPSPVPYLYLNVHVMPVSKSSMETNNPSFSVRHGKWASDSFYTTKTSCQNENKIYEIAERTPITCWKVTLTKNEKPYTQILNHHNR